MKVIGKNLPGFAEEVILHQDELLVSDISSNEVILYDRNEGGTENWGEIKKFSLTDSVGYQFGKSISRIENHIFVGAPYALSGDKSGCVIIYGRDAGGENNWGIEKVIVSETPDNLFGVSLTSYDNYVGVSNKNADSKKVYLYRRDLGGEDNWGLETEILSPDDISSNYFGEKLAMNSSTLAIADRGIPVDQFNTGVVHLYQKSGTNWRFFKTITGSNSAKPSVFGSDVELKNSTLLVGAKDEVINYEEGRGTVYHYTENYYGEMNWGLVGKLEYTHDNYNNKAYFGQSISYSSEFILVGAKRFIVLLKTEALTDVEVNASKINNFHLKQNFPNPFNPSTRIDYQLKENSKVMLDVFNIVGEQVTNLFDEYQDAGQHSVVFDGSNLSSGVYLYRLQVFDEKGKIIYSQCNKMVLIK